MLLAPAVACEISAPPTTPRGTSRSGPGLTTLMQASLFSAAGLRGCARRRDLDLQRRLRGLLVVDLQSRMVDLEPHAEHLLEPVAQLVAIVAGAHDDVCGQRREAGGHLPD